jgi:hypothetical protein
VPYFDILLLVLISELIYPAIMIHNVYSFLRCIRLECRTISLPDCE